MKNAPLLAVGNFGVHCLSNPAGSFSFVGQVPNGLEHSQYASEEEGINAFVLWLKALDVELQREYVSNLRNDVFVKFMTL